MKIVVSGSSGLIGSALVPALRADGHEVLRLVRRPVQHADEIQWQAGQTSPGELAARLGAAGVTAGVHLAGAGVGDHRWTDAYRRTVRDSRVHSTALLAGAFAQLDGEPRVLLSGSAVGYYGDTGDRIVDESAPPGAGFLAEVCEAWEAATSAAEAAGVRVVHLRTGIVLSRHGGALGKQLPLYRLGLGGPLGSGRQWQSWITLDDEVRAIQFLLANDVQGAVNLVAPDPVRQRDFAKALGAAVHRPAVLPAPAFALRALLGGFADEGVLTGQRVRPRVLDRAGFTFTSPDLPGALRQLPAR